MKSESSKVDFSRIPWQSPAPDVRFKSYQASGRKLRLVKFGKDFIENDWCTNGHIGYVLKGSLEIDFEATDTTVRYTAGDGIFIEKGEDSRHKARILTESAMLILVEDD